MPDPVHNIRTPKAYGTAQVYGAVLAGGQSRRMGRDKSQLVFNTHTLLEHAAGILRQGGISTPLISHRDFIADIIPECGPLGGIHAVLTYLLAHAAQDASVIFTAVDMPALSPVLINRLVTTRMDSNDALIRFDGQTFPFRLQVKNQHVKLIESLINRVGNKSVQNFQKQLSSKLIENTFNTSTPFRNVNTPRDWSDFIEETSGEIAS